MELSIEEKQALIGKSIPVLDQGYVQLLDFMPHPLTGISGDLAIVNAARTSYNGESKGPEKDKKLLFYLYKHKHTSPMEMIEFKFRLYAPLLTFWQLVRHRMASLNFSSGRYTEFTEDAFYVPLADEWRLQSKDNKQASKGGLISTQGELLTQALINHYASGYQLYEQALEAGVAREQARLFLPGFSVYYTFVWKIDVHNLLHFLKLRQAEDAQYEIRVYADVIYNEFFKPMLPWLAEAYEKYPFVLKDDSTEKKK
jgi:thymidylate synthase (FAD)